MLSFESSIGNGGGRKKQYSSGQSKDQRERATATSTGVNGEESLESGNGTKLPIGQVLEGKSNLWESSSTSLEFFGFLHDQDRQLHLTTAPDK